MMNLLLRQSVPRSIIVVIVFIGFSLVSLPFKARAHGGPPRLELSADRVNPGAVIEVRGINLAPETTIAIVLVHNNLETPLGYVLSDAQGDFSQALALPVDLAEGEYTVRVIGQDQTPVSASLKIEGAATAEEGGQRGEEEPLLAPMPLPGRQARLHRCLQSLRGRISCSPECGVTLAGRR